ncbi:MAG: hypothetical protein QXS20_03190, partial [Candidatus Thorarchaeota archaeon]
MADVTSLVGGKVNVEALYVTHDSDMVYAACRDMRVRVWPKDEFARVMRLEGFSSPLVSIHVDGQDIFVTTQKRIHLWRKSTWGMVGWFELSCNACSSVMTPQHLYIGSDDGRMLAIGRADHDASSWQLHRAEITSMWTDGETIVTLPKKEQPCAWRHLPNQPPTEIQKLETKQATVISGNDRFVFIGTSLGDIEFWDRSDWSLALRLSTGLSQPVTHLTAT